MAVILCAFSIQAAAQTAPDTPPPSPRAKLNFDLNWKFIRDDVAGAEAPGFDDSSWTTVSTPHTFNDVDSFRQVISHSGGDRGTDKGLSWYCKHFKVPARYAGDKIFLEFEGMRQAGDIFLNGKQIGIYENGVTAYGVDITSAVHFGNEENVLAVKVDNRTDYKERSSGTPFEWNANDFYPDHGGIKLTPIVGPRGLQADGEDVALIDVEVVDAKGQRCPTDDARVDFAVAGPAVWRGGYNRGKIDSTNNLFLNAEDGINRVSVRSTLSPGTITVTASRSGLQSAQIKIVAKPLKIVDGLAEK